MFELEITDSSFSPRSGALNLTNYLIKNTQDLLTITEMIFINRGGIYENTEIDDFSEIYPLIKLFIIKEISSSLWDVSVILQNFDIQATDTSPYNLYQLVHLLEKKMDDGFIDKEILALMDAYIEAVKSGEIILGGATESPILQYSPPPGNK